MEAPELEALPPQGPGGGRPAAPAHSRAFPPQIHMKTMPAAMYRLLTAQEQPVYI